MQERRITRWTPSTSADYPEKQQAVCKAGKMQVLPEIRRVFGTFHLQRWRPTPPRQDHCRKELASPEKCGDAKVIPGLLWTSTDDSSQVLLEVLCLGPSCLQKTLVVTTNLTMNMLLFKWDTGCCASPSWSIMIRACLHESRLTLLAKPLGLCWIKNILMADTLKSIHQELWLLQSGTTRFNNNKCSPWSMLSRSGDTNCWEWR